MNIQQFQYVLALAELRHSEKAAERCFVSQSTLSTMVSRFEDELGISIFDRRKKPIGITAEGAEIINQLKKINKEIEGLVEISDQMKGDIKGKLTIAVIPTIAPNLLHLFLPHFAARFPDLSIEVRELTTGEIMRLIKSRELDIGIVSVPLSDPEIVEHHLYDEPFVFFDAAVPNKGTIKIKQLDLGNLCLLEEGHCMRNQVLEFCDFHDELLNNKLNFRYKAGSIDSLLRFVKTSKASTLLPLLSALELPARDQKYISSFADPIPYRSIGLVVHTHFVKHKILQLLGDEIVERVQPLLPSRTFKGKRMQPLKK